MNELWSVVAVAALLGVAVAALTGAWNEFQERGR